MRLKPKFKIFKQLKNWQNTDYFPTKLSKTTKKSWKTVISTYNDIKQKNLISESKLNLNSTVKIKRWEFNKKAYKTGLEIKRYYYHLFNHIIRNKYLKQIYLNKAKKYKQNNFCNTTLYLIAPTFRLDILLWSLNFFNSTYEARNNIFNKNVFLNINKQLHPNEVVKSGDIISLKNFNKNLTFKKLYNKNLHFKKQFYNFCEVDYYTKNLVIIKDIKNILQTYQNPQTFYKKLDIRKFITYLKNEY